VEKGELEYVIENEKGEVFIKTLKMGDVFGKKTFFTNEPREVSVRSKNFSTLFELKQNEFLSVIRKNKDDYVKNLLFL